MIQVDAKSGVLSLQRPDDPIPLVFDSPHSGTSFPSDFRANLDHTLIIRTSDLYVDKLFAGVVEHGAHLLQAHFPRAYVDVNRAVDDLDEALLEPGWRRPLAPSQKSALGKGLIWRVAMGGRPIYASRLRIAEVERRITNYYEAYHQALQELNDELHQRFGQVWHVNCHSMKSMSTKMDAEGAGINRQDIVLSDREGRSASPAFVELVKLTLENEGLKVALNYPFKGAEIIRRHGLPLENRHSIQVEINRALYMNERTLQTHAGIEALRAAMSRLSAVLADYCRSQV